jgi:hypothetical protein
VKLIARLKAAWAAFKQSQPPSEVEQIKNRIRQGEPVSLDEALRLGKILDSRLPPTGAELDARPSRIKEWDKYRNNLATAPGVEADALRELDEAFPVSYIQDVHIYTQDEYETIGTFLKDAKELRLEWLHSDMHAEPVSYDVQRNPSTSNSRGLRWGFKSLDSEETVKVLLFPSRHPSNQLVEAGIVMCIVQNEEERNSHPATARQYFIGFATSQTRFLLIGETGAPSATAIAHQLKKFIVDSRRPEPEQHYKLESGGSQCISRFSGGMHQISCQYDKDIEAKLMAELPPVEVANES